MNYRKNGLRLLGLLAAAALGVMALAASAQALTPGFLIGKAAVGALLATATGEQEVGTTSSLLVPGLNFKLTCTAFTVDEGHIASNSSATAVLLYTGCTTLEFKSPFAEIKCQVLEPIKAEAVLLPTEMLKEGTEELPFAILAEKIKALVPLFLPKTNDEVPCSLPEDNLVTGELCLKIVPATNDTTAPLVETSDTIQKLCKPLSKLEGVWADVINGETHEKIQAREELKPPTAFLDELKYGAQLVTVDGKAIVKLTGAHAGKTLGVSLY